MVIYLAIFESAMAPELGARLLRVIGVALIIAVDVDIEVASAFTTAEAVVVAVAGT